MDLRTFTKIEKRLVSLQKEYDNIFVFLYKGNLMTEKRRDFFKTYIKYLNNGENTNQFFIDKDKFNQETIKHFAMGKNLLLHIVDGILLRAINLTESFIEENENQTERLLGVIEKLKEDPEQQKINTLKAYIKYYIKLIPILESQKEKDIILKEINRLEYELDYLEG